MFYHSVLFTYWLCVKCIDSKISDVTLKNCVTSDSVTPGSVKHQYHGYSSDE